MILIQIFILSLKLYDQRIHVLEYSFILGIFCLFKLCNLKLESGLKHYYNSISLNIKKKI